MKYFRVAVWQEKDDIKTPETIISAMARDALSAKVKAIKMFKQDSSFDPRLPIKVRLTSAVE